MVTCIFKKKSWCPVHNSQNHNSQWQPWYSVVGIRPQFPRQPICNTISFYSFCSIFSRRRTKLILRRRKRFYVWPTDVLWLDYDYIVPGLYGAAWCTSARPHNFLFGLAMAFNQFGSFNLYGYASHRPEFCRTKPSTARNVCVCVCIFWRYCVHYHYVYLI